MKIMNWKEDMWIWIKIVMILVASVSAGFVDPGAPDPTSYPFVTAMPLLFFALFLPMFLRRCETTKRYISRVAVWRTHPFLIGSGALPLYHFSAWSFLAGGFVALPVALFADRDLGTAFFMLSSGVGCLIGVHRALKRDNVKDVEHSGDAR